MRTSEVTGELSWTLRGGFEGLLPAIAERFVARRVFGAKSRGLFSCDLHGAACATPEFETPCLDYIDRFDERADHGRNSTV
jgi:hypothetical protein